jgi:hypothetical protein
MENDIDVFENQKEMWEAIEPLIPKYSQSFTQLQQAVGYAAQLSDSDKKMIDNAIAKHIGMSNPSIGTDTISEEATILLRGFLAGSARAITPESIQNQAEQIVKVLSNKDHNIFQRVLDTTWVDHSTYSTDSRLVQLFFQGRIKVDPDFGNIQLPSPPTPLT